MGTRDLTTRKGHSLFTMASMYQKSIRRGDAQNAAYAAGELYDRYPFYLWRRTMVIAAEDCFGCISDDIYALWQCEQEVNKNKHGDERTRIFIAKAIVLLLHARKNRDADYLACNLMDTNELKIEAELVEFDQAKLSEIPEYVYDIHTLEGKKSGKSKADFAKDEMLALKNGRVGLFDNCEWDFGIKD